MPKAAAAEWRRVMPVLAERRVLSAADLTALETYARAVGDAAEARQAIVDGGAYLVNARGELKRHPAFATLREATAEQRRWAAELGLTPASRGRVASDAPDDDLADKFDL